MLFLRKTAKSEAKRRGVQRLFHSTHLYKNLPAILSDGAIYTARDLAKHYGSSAGRFLHDPRRYERFAVGLDFVNASLTFPNCELLYKRSRTEWKCEWIHFSLKLDLLNKSDTLFCSVSAATDFGKHLQSGLSGFQGMFADPVDGYSRAILTADIPTHPQAEILIRGSLDLENVESIIVPDLAVAGEIERICDQNNRRIRVEILPQFFVWPKWLAK